MKVLLINGSPRRAGCTFTALSEIARVLQDEGVDTEIFHLGTGAVFGCIACLKCRDGSRRCVFDNDGVNRALDIAEGCDGFIFGSPIYYASVNGALCAFLDRFFFTGNDCSGKPGAGVVVARRAGTTAGLDRLNKYFQISNMPVVSSQYWNMVHGFTPDEVRRDLEGMQIMRTLARNMAWLLKCIRAGRDAGIPFPPPEPERMMTNFIS